MTVEFRTLGGVAASVEGRRLDLGHARQRCVLLALLVDANQVVAADQLVDRVWGERLPQRARGALYNYLSRLRHILRAGEGVSIVRSSGGYLLTVDPLAVDLHLFDNLTARARAAEDDDESAALFARALALWRGEAFAMLDTPWVNAVRHRVDDRRTAAELDRNDVELRRGRHGEILAELSARAVASPLDERVAGQLMLALYRSGRQADAVDCYQRTRSRLAEDLGVDPGRALRMRYQQILNADPTLDGPAAEARRRRIATPRQLPAPPRSFTGRAGELAQLDAILTTAGAEARVVAMSGVAGAGKTTLAVRWAHRVAERFPDGQLYIDLRGFDAGGVVVDPAGALRGFLEALGVPAERVPVRLPARAALYRSLLAGKRILVLLDNARDAAQARALLPGTPGCLTVVTSRDRLTSLVAAEGAHPLALHRLSDAEAFDLLSRRLGPQRVAGEPDAVRHIVAGCVGLPLALVIAAARAGTQPHLALAVLAGELRAAADAMAAGVPTHADASIVLDAFGDGDPAADLRAVFSWSYRTLSPAAAELFLLLGLHPGPDISMSAAASLAGVSTRQIQAPLAELTRAHLITELVPRRYTLHDLVRAYATELVHRDWADDRRRAALHRVLDHYLHSAHRAYQLLDFPRDTFEPARPQPGVTIDDPVGDHGALAWFTREHRVLLAAVGRAHNAGFDRHAWQLARALDRFLQRRSLFDDMAAANGVALGAARRLADPTAQAYALFGLGTADSMLGRPDAARIRLRQALELFTELGNETGQVRTHGKLAGLAATTGHYGAAIGHCRRGLALCRVAGTTGPEAVILNDIGWYHAQRGEYQKGRVFCLQALRLQQEQENGYAAAYTWDSLGYIYRGLGQLAKAVTCYQRASGLFEQFRDERHQAEALLLLGDAHWDDGSAPAARDSWHSALDIFARLNHPDIEQVRERLARHR